MLFDPAAGWVARMSSATSVFVTGVNNENPLQVNDFRTASQPTIIIRADIITYLVSNTVPASLFAALS